MLKIEGIKIILITAHKNQFVVICYGARVASFWVYIIRLHRSVDKISILYLDLFRKLKFSNDGEDYWDEQDGQVHDWRVAFRTVIVAFAGRWADGDDSLEKDDVALSLAEDVDGHTGRT